MQPPFQDETEQPQHEPRSSSSNSFNCSNLPPQSQNTSHPSPPTSLRLNLPPPTFPGSPSPNRSDFDELRWKAESRNRSGSGSFGNNKLYGQEGLGITEHVGGNGNGRLSSGANEDGIHTGSMRSENGLPGNGPELDSVIGSSGGRGRGNDAVLRSNRESWDSQRGEKETLFPSASQQPPLFPNSNPSSFITPSSSFASSPSASSQQAFSRSRSRSPTPMPSNPYPSRNNPSPSPPASSSQFPLSSAPPPQAQAQCPNPSLATIMNPNFPSPNQYSILSSTTPTTPMHLSTSQLPPPPSPFASPQSSVPRLTHVPPSPKAGLADGGEGLEVRRSNPGNQQLDQMGIMQHPPTTLSPTSPLPSPFASPLPSRTPSPSPSDTPYGNPSARMTPIGGPPPPGSGQLPHNRFPPPPSPVSPFSVPYSQHPYSHSPSPSINSTGTSGDHSSISSSRPSSPALSISSLSLEMPSSASHPERFVPPVVQQQQGLGWRGHHTYEMSVGNQSSEGWFETAARGGRGTGSSSSQSSSPRENLSDLVTNQSQDSSSSSQHLNRQQQKHHRFESLTNHYLPPPAQPSFSFEPSAAGLQAQSGAEWLRIMEPPSPNALTTMSGSGRGATIGRRSPRPTWLGPEGYDNADGYRMGENDGKTPTTKRFANGTMTTNVPTGINESSSGSSYPHMGVVNTSTAGGGVGAASGSSAGIGSRGVRRRMSRTGADIWREDNQQRMNENRNGNSEWGNDEKGKGKARASPPTSFASSKPAGSNSNAKSHGRILSLTSFVDQRTKLASKSPRLESGFMSPGMSERKGGWGLRLPGRWRFGRKDKGGDEGGVGWGLDPGLDFGLRKKNKQRKESVSEMRIRGRRNGFAGFLGRIRSLMDTPTGVIGVLVILLLVGILALRGILGDQPVASSSSTFSTGQGPPHFSAGQDTQSQPMPPRHQPAGELLKHQGFPLTSPPGYEPKISGRPVSRWRRFFDSFLSSFKNKDSASSSWCRLKGGCSSGGESDINGARSSSPEAGEGKRLKSKEDTIPGPPVAVPRAPATPQISPKSSSSRKNTIFSSNRREPEPTWDSPERDTLVVYRILGNDLPPRHELGQTLRNLKFMLKEEVEFWNKTYGESSAFPDELFEKDDSNKGIRRNPIKRVEKYYLLNRISNGMVWDTIVEMLEEYGVPEDRILEIPFDWGHYERIGFNWNWGGSPGVPGSGRQMSEEEKEAWKRERARSSSGRVWGIGKGEEDEMDVKAVGEVNESERKWREGMERLRALDFTYERKNLYAINNNGGRNAALLHGRSLPHARWILPLDGNCFFTPPAMYSLVRSLTIHGEGASHEVRKSYVVIPMARTLSNDVVLANGANEVPDFSELQGLGSELTGKDLEFWLERTSPFNKDEPQIGFRYDSTASYQLAMRYGHRSKLELLWRLGAVPYSKGLDKRTNPWETSDKLYVTAESWASVRLPEWTKEGQRNSDTFAFIRAGWVYRLFSGSREQEVHSQQGIALRNINRMKAIAGFLEKLDEQIARGRHHRELAAEAKLSGQPVVDDDGDEKCGFDSGELWTWRARDLETFKVRLEHEYLSMEREMLIGSVNEVVESTLDILKRRRVDPDFGDFLIEKDASDVAFNSTILALTGFLLSNNSLTALASDLIQARFLPKGSLDWRSASDSATPSSSAGLEDELHSSVNQTYNQALMGLSERDGVGYAFPIPLAAAKENTQKGWIMTSTVPPAKDSFPFDPLTFDPTLLLDAVRLLSEPFVSSNSRASSSLSRPLFDNLISAHLSYLLFDPEAIRLSRYPSSLEVGAKYDSVVASEAAFLDNAILLSRVAHRARLRLSNLDPEEMNAFVGLGPHHHRLILNGLRFTAFHPFSHLFSALELEEIEEGGSGGFDEAGSGKSTHDGLIGLIFDHLLRGADYHSLMPGTGVSFAGSLF